MSRCSWRECVKPSKIRSLCWMHYTRLQRHGSPDVLKYPTRALSLQDHFWSLVEKADGCWPWKGYVRPDGYGEFYKTGASERRAHRMAYVLTYGSIPEGLTLDHLCRNPRCVRPDHLEAVTMGVNVLRGNGMSARHARQTHCVHGHPFDEVNTYITSTNARFCRACHRERQVKYQRAKRAQEVLT